MTKSRLEAFSDGVLAIVITVMVLNFKTPPTADLSELRGLAGPILGYVLSFLYVGIYWNNHHHLLAASKRINGAVLWANLHLLFWLSLFPFSTNWMSQSDYAFWPVVLYGSILLCAAIAYYLLTLALLAAQEKDSTLAAAIGNDLKGKLSIALYLTSILLALLHPLAACFGYFAVACIWLVPDRRIEPKLKS